MEKEKVIDLGSLTGEQHVTALTGKERGISARTQLALDELDAEEGNVTVAVPSYVVAISSSFFLGLFSGSLRAFPSEEAFLRKYRFDASESIMHQVRNGIKNGLIDRGRLVR